MDTPGKFYLGRGVDPAQGKTSTQALEYEMDDLTTHAVVVGMTGSGKTGLCIGMLEEAALNGIPALMVDPKGDITNLLLHFPELLPADFQPWVNPDQARRDGMTIEQAAAATAQNWRKGLADWGISAERIRKLKDSAHFTVYTPGSDSGVPISILASFKAPAIPWEENTEVLREKISGTVTAVLGLAGLSDLDPVSSREHILLSNLFETAWSQGRDLDLGELILQTQSPPFKKLGVFDVNTFFPEKDRFALAMQLNNILASPSFQVWMEGEPLEISSLLYAADGQPRHCVFYIAHLGDSERMFFVTLLFSAVEAWMRTQSGTGTLRALLYFDEIFGYLPPVSNPPSKMPMLRMLKQARAFGVGLVLVTQNPVDLDYKGLSNAGTWFIGKLQTDRDKQRLLDGLEGVQGGEMDRSWFDRAISGLGKRVFLLHNVHANGPQLFQTRWAMNYLAGPLARTQIRALNQLVKAGGNLEAEPPGIAGPALASSSTLPAASPLPAAQPTERKPQPIQAAALGTRPAVPSGAEEYILPNNLTFTEAFQIAGQPYPQEAHSLGLVYRPVLLAQASIRFLERKYNLDSEIFQTVLVVDPDRRGMLRWENFPAAAVDPAQVQSRPDPQARFAGLEEPLTDARLLAAMKNDFVDWTYRSAQVKVRANETLEVYAGPQMTQAEFMEQCSEAARQGREAEAGKLADSYDSKIARLQEKLASEERELGEDQDELSDRKLEELGTAAENVLGMFTRRRTNLSRSLTKRRMTGKAKADVKESLDTIASLKKQIADLEGEKAETLAQVNDRWGNIVDDSHEILLHPLKKDVLVDLFGVAWFPYYQVQIGAETRELPAYAAEGSG